MVAGAEEASHGECNQAEADCQTNYHSGIDCILEMMVMKAKMKMPMKMMHLNELDSGDDGDEDLITTVAIPGVATAVFFAITGEILCPVIPGTGAD